MNFKFSVALALIIAATVTGIYFQLFSKTIDHPVEQAAEKVLSNHGVDIDFSEDKKKNAP